MARQTMPRRLADLAYALDTHLRASEPTLTSYARDVQQAVGAEIFAAYSLTKPEADAHYEVDRLHMGDFPCSPADLRKAFGKVSQPWGFYDPLKPARPQRNVALLMDELQARYGKLPNRCETFLREVGIFGLDQVRTLVCDGRVLLAWVGGFREGRFQ